MHGFSYERLAFHLLDSQSFALLCVIPWADSEQVTLQRNISEAGWKAIKRAGGVRRRDWKRGSVRLDSTAVESDIITRRTVLCSNAVGEPAAGAAQGATGRAASGRPSWGSRALLTGGARGAKRQRAYRDLLKVARKAYDYQRRYRRAAVNFCRIFGNRR